MRLEDGRLRMLENAAALLQPGAADSRAPQRAQHTSSSGEKVGVQGWTLQRNVGNLRPSPGKVEPTNKPATSKRETLRQRRSPRRAEPWSRPSSLGRAPGASTQHSSKRTTAHRRP